MSGPPNRKPPAGPVSQLPQVPVFYSEDLPGPKLDGSPHVLNVQCHKIGLVRFAWDPYARTVVALCAECGQPGAGFKIEKKNKLALDPVPPMPQ